MGRLMRIGTRASALARWQAEWVAARLAEVTGEPPELVLIKTRGDETAGGTATNTGETGVFTKEIQRALLAREIDLAVHSLKDLPTESVSELLLAAVPERESAADVLISREGKNFGELKRGANIGTGSLRRRAQLLHVRPDLRMSDIRGNIDTRLAKLAAGEFDAIVLAEAGLRRLGMQSRITEVLSLDVMLPAVGQGALGIEARASDAQTLATLKTLDHHPSRTAVLAERALLAALAGGCLAPVGALAMNIADDRLRLRAAVCGFDGTVKLEASSDDSIKNPEALGRHVAEQLLARGAAELIRASRGQRGSDFPDGTK